MFQHLKRILMQAVGDTAGGGTGAPPAQPSTPPATAVPPPAAPSTPPAAPAPGAPAAATLTPELARAVENSVNAALRRAGLLGQNGPQPTPSAQPALATAPAPQAAQQDLGRLRALDRALSTSGIAARLDERAYQRLERDFIQESPTDATEWAWEYVRGFGITRTAGTPAPATPPAAPPASAPTTPPATQPPPAAAAPAGTQQPNTQPVSNGGGPPAPREHVEDVDLVGASQADREHLLKTKGLKWYTDTLEKQMRDRRVRVR